MLEKARGIVEMGGRGRTERREERWYLESPPNSSMINTFVYVHVPANRIEARLGIAAAQSCAFHVSNQTAIQNGKSVYGSRHT